MSQPDRQTSKGQKDNTAPFAPGSSAFPVSKSPLPTFSMSGKSSLIPPSALQQLQIAQQQALQQQALRQATMQQQALQQQAMQQQQQPQSVPSGTQPNQFFVMTTTATSAAPQASQVLSGITQLPQVQVPVAAPMPSAPAPVIPLVPAPAPSAPIASPNANTSSPPFLISDPNGFMQTFQLNPQALQQQQQQPQAVPQQPQVMSQQEPSNVQAPKDTAQACVNIIQQALKDPQYATAGQVLLQAMQSSSSYMNNLMNPAVPCTTNKTVDEPKTVRSQDPAPNTVNSNKSVQPNPEMFFLESSLQPVKREEDDGGMSSGEEDMWKLFLKSDDDFGGLNSSCAPSAPPSSNVPQPLAAPPVPADNNTPYLQSLIATSPALQPVSAMATPVISSSMSTVPARAPPPMALNDPPEKPVKLAPAPAVNTPDLQSLIATSPALQPIGAMDPPAKTVKLAPVRAECGKVKKPSPPWKKPPISFEFQGSPQQYLMAILKERGYLTDRIPNADSGYHTKPTPLQLASFGTEVVKASNAGDATKLSALLDCGLSPNPCNSFRDFLVLMVCKRAKLDILKCLVEHGCNLEVCDSFGRTPLHCVAWAGEFCSGSAELILDRSSTMMLIEDNRGQCPLEYVRKSDYPKWINFLREKMDTYWPIDGADEPRMSSSSQDEPAPTISVDLASAVASGSMKPEAVASMDELTKLQYKQETFKDLLTIY